MRLILATQNPGKVMEIAPLLTDLPIEVKTLADVGIHEQDPELGDSLEHNSAAKAQTAFNATKEWTLADDTGVEFPALNYGPGVDTKEWIGSRTDPGEFEEFLRNQFKDTDDLSGTFRTVMTIIRPDHPDTAWNFSGEVHGHLTLDGRGEPRPGLPFCRHFIPDGQDKTLSEMSEDDLRKYNHRTIAIEKVCDFIRQHIGA